jgi:hypothetical protein
VFAKVTCHVQNLFQFPYLLKQTVTLTAEMKINVLKLRIVVLTDVLIDVINNQIAFII